MLSKLLKTLSFTVLLGGLSLTSHAAIIEYNSSFSTNNTSNYNTTYGYSFGDSNLTSSSLSLARFDSGLGTLTDVEVSFTSEWDHFSYASAYDNSSERSSYRDCNWWGSCSTYYRYRNDTFVNMTSSADFSLSLIDPFQSTSATRDSNYDNCSRSYSTSGSVGCSDSTNDDGIFNGVLDTSMFSLNDFIGSDDLDFSFNINAAMTGYCDNNDNGDRCSGYNDAYWRGNISVAYTYDEVTAPGVAVLLSIGLLGLLARRKRA
ncbi:choice-of-anchor E domain-containing protein [Alteromonas sp. W364]|uniref:choice-of-anchor E domain-containing protein n=1 Tax=Alteromonas sp. W364 TaxID=3075610 RepID=UPI002888C5D5|nr:choice-of-anchor E domain-containing protein [Alteromonas sp. W364]MDT0627628.1 choice-of-anchor E domain-containing protein [Alteromonas sp. W364]